ncbi:MAG TPA: hypothetical protein VFW40_12625 [Capsulimonadaceae bacterium]|nr:hypothetical protein [Capsulimonadaceae bacterium]
MKGSIVEQEAQRARWHRYREGLQLDNPLSTTFAHAGLGQRVEMPSLRLLILHSDLDGVFLDFNQEFWNWWRSERIDPLAECTDQWLQHTMPTAAAAIRFLKASDDKWMHYMALGRNGSFEMELGEGAAFERSNRRNFNLTYSIGRVWYAFSVFSDVCKHLQLAGPVEITIGLIRTENSQITGFGDGWAEPGSGFAMPTTNPGPNAMFRLELETWPTNEAIQALAFRFGDWMEDVWGSQYRRYLSRQGPRAGRLDPRKYQYVWY